MLQAQKHHIVLRLVSTNPEDTPSIVDQSVFIKRCVCAIHSPAHNCVCHLIGKWLRVIDTRRSSDGTMNYRIVTKTKLFYVQREEFWTHRQYNTLWEWGRYNRGCVQKILEKFFQRASVPPSL
ncbi:MAG: hypothetical protein AAB523_00435 [Patescibacteria group bacterium]